jgi:DNA-binding MarR family transcriptional regulator
MAFLIHDVARLLRRKMDHATQGSGLTSAQWRVITSIARRRSMNLEPLNQAELADMLDVEPITLSRQIDRLAAAKLIERRLDPHDRRAHRQHLTDKAAPMVAAFREIGSKMLTEALDGISEVEVAAITALLGRIRTNLTGKDGTVVPFAEARTPAGAKTAAKARSVKRGAVS